MTTLSSLGLHIILLSNLTNATVSSFDPDRVHTAVMRLSSNCTSTYVRLDQYDRVELTSSVWPLHDSIIQANTSCTAHFMTGNKGQGICIHSNDLFFKRQEPRIHVKVYTSKFGPERAFNHAHSKFRNWCTPHSLVTIELSTLRDFYNQNGEYRYSFLISNVSKDGIDTHYHLDSFNQCNLSHTLKSGEEMRISGQRYPSPDRLPSNCLLHLETSSTDEYEELCILIDDYRLVDNCLSKLEVSGLNSRFWPETEYLGCNDTNSQLRSKTEMCSGAKFLTINLTRSAIDDTGMIFKATVKVKKHPFWEVISNEQSELRGLGFVKGLTFFIAAINSFAGIGAAILASMIRHPRSFWKNWAETMNATHQCTPVHYEGEYKNHDVTYPEVSTSHLEEVTEAKAY
ncbi:unnamed protein product [Lymnaea stagnalis]|uniref:Uncharacterized protein n=1 Tax=Lymnaea stagnalis TaxID=6523 RepID=A0AAV2I794_LYMST